MATEVRHIQASFTEGEVSPRLLARVDLDAYDRAVKTMENAISLPHGGAKRRYGTSYVGSVDDPTKDVRVIPFVYSTTNSYALVLNNGKIQFVMDGFFVEDSGTRVEITHPWGDSDLQQVTYAQFGSTVFFAHPHYSPKQLIRNSDTDWQLTDITFDYKALADQWFENAYLRFKIITTASDDFNVGDKFEFTTDGNGNISSSPVFTAASGGGTPKNGEIVQITVKDDHDEGETWTIECVFSEPGRTEWTITGNVTTDPEPAKWYDQDYPAAVSFFEQRLYFAGSPSYPQTVWGSEAGNYTNFTVGPLTNDGVEFPIASNRFDQIIQLESARQLLPLSYGTEFSLAGTSNNGITPQAVTIRSHTFHGTKQVEPQRIGEEVLFVQRDGKKVRAISYNVTLDQNVAPDLTLIAEHITGEGKGVTDMSYAQAPDQLLWATRDDGVLLACTHMREQQVTSWTRCITDGQFRSVATIPEQNVDTTYVAVEREIDGNTVKYIEILDDTYYVDAGLKGSVSEGDETKTWSGLDHLEGKEVDIVYDGKVHKRLTVESGQVTLDEKAQEVQIGLPFTSTIELLHPNVATAGGTAQGSQLRIWEAVIRVQDTIGLRVEGKDVPTMTFSDNFNEAPTPYTGDYDLKQLGWRTPNNLKIQQVLPQPWTILGVVMKLRIGSQ